MIKISFDTFGSSKHVFEICIMYHRRNLKAMVMNHAHIFNPRNVKPLLDFQNIDVSGVGFNFSNVFQHIFINICWTILHNYAKDLTNTILGARWVNVFLVLHWM